MSGVSVKWVVMARNRDGSKVWPVAVRDTRDEAIDAMADWRRKELLDGLHGWPGDYAMYIQSTEEGQ